MKEIKPSQNNGNWRISFMYQKVRFSLSGFGRVEERNSYEKCLEVCQKINQDISNGEFDCSNNAELTLKYNHNNLGKFLNNQILENLKVEENEVKEKLISDLKERLLEKFCAPDNTLLNILLKYDGQLETSSQIKVFVNHLKENRTNSTVKRFLNTLKTLDDNFKDVKIEVNTKPITKIYSVEEIELILNWFKKDKYYDYYYNFVLFLCLTGCRVSEAIGLRWQDVDLRKGKVYIFESLARSKNSSTKRIRKTTKNKKLRVLPINNQLKQLFFSIENKKEEDLIFTGRNGKVIDDHAFSQRAYKKCIENLKLFGTPNTLRHTFISHLLINTKDIVYVASLTHNSRSGVKTIVDNYAHLIDDREIPEFFSLD